MKTAAVIVRVRAGVRATNFLARAQAAVSLLVGLSERRSEGMARRKGTSPLDVEVVVGSSGQMRRSGRHCYIGQRSRGRVAWALRKRCDAELSQTNESREISWRLGADEHWGREAIE